LDQLLRHVLQRRLGNPRLDDIPNLQEEGPVVSRQRIVAKDGDRPLTRVQNAPRRFRGDEETAAFSVELGFMDRH
jgi:hypothetical protein